MGVDTNFTVSVTAVSRKDPLSNSLFTINLLIVMEQYTHHIVVPPHLPPPLKIHKECQKLSWGVHKSESRSQQRAQIRFSIHQTTISIFCEDNHIYADLIRLAPSLRGFNLINLVAILKLVALLHPPPSHHHIRFFSFQIRTKKKFLVIKLSDLCKTFCFEI